MSRLALYLLGSPRLELDGEPIQVGRRKAVALHRHLLVAQGNCNAYSGVGDAYLPFREVMGMLTGDVEARWAAGAISREHAQHLWAGLPFTLQALVDHGPSFIGTVVSGAALSPQSGCS